MQEQIHIHYVFLIPGPEPDKILSSGPPAPVPAAAPWLKIPFPEDENTPEISRCRPYPPGPFLQWE